MSNGQIDDFDFSNLLQAYQRVRQQSETLCDPLIAEDYVIQTIPDVSPPKWHLAHVSWFFETFILIPFRVAYRPFNPQFNVLFNSYYQGIGTPFPRAKRGLLSRPSVTEVYQYREYVDHAMIELIDGLDLHPEFDRILELIVLGLNHEQQHQELLLTDIKHILAQNPLFPIYRERPRINACAGTKLRWLTFAGGLTDIGYDGNSFHFDNESPRHTVLLNDFTLASRPITNREYLDFIEDGSYDNPLLWLSDGWAARQKENWQAPLYWHSIDNAWQIMTLAGLQPLDPNEPVCHVSYFEADAYATWANKRLPIETEWEKAGGMMDLSDGNFLEECLFHPRPAPPGEGLMQAYGDVWEWTRSSYLGYPGYRPPQGAIGEYNGKFMCNQFVLRGGSCVTPKSHIRLTYRNFFYPHNRWQFMGFRLAEDA